MERITGHYDKIILTFIMCLVILFMATFSPFAESTKAVGVISGAVIAIFIAGLAAVGITFVTTGAYSTLEEYVENLFIEYAASQNTTPQDLLRGTQSGTNKLGQIIINNRFVVLISTFGAWIKAKFSLTNNSTKVIQAVGATLGDLSAYNLPLTLEANNPSNNDISFTILTSTSPCYAIFGTIRTNTIVNIISESAATIRVLSIYPNGTISSTSDNTLNYNSNYGLYYSNSLLSTSTYNFSGYNVYTDAVVTEALRNNGGLDVNNIGIDIVTGDITLPLDDDNYTDGDGAIIDTDAGWGATYTDVTEDTIPDAFSDSKEGDASIEYVSEDEVAEEVVSTSEITNLPAGAIPFVPLSLPQFNLLSIWHYVQQWIEDTAIAAGSLMAIATQAPQSMVNMFYAIVCLAIIFGFIKGLAK